jgi:hypothetical protein
MLAKLFDERQLLLDDSHGHNVEDAAGVGVFRVRKFVVAPTGRDNLWKILILFRRELIYSGLSNYNPGLAGRNPREHTRCPPICFISNYTHWIAVFF